MITVTLKIHRHKKINTVCAGCKTPYTKRNDLGWTCKNCFSFNRAKKLRPKAKKNNILTITPQ